MSKRATLLILFTSISLAGLVVLIAAFRSPPMTLISQGQDSVSQPPAIHISLANSDPDSEAGKPKTAIKEAMPQPEQAPESKPVPEKEEKPTPEPEQKPAKDPEPVKKPEPKQKPEPKPKNVPAPEETASEPDSETDTDTSENNGLQPSEETAKPEDTTQKQLRAGTSATTDNYLAKLVRHLSAYRDYPRRARRMHMEGKPVVVFEFDRTGRLQNYRLLEGSTHQILDKAALDMLKEASPFPPVPDDMTGKTFRFQLPVSFKLN